LHQKRAKIEKISENVKCSKTLMYQGLLGIFLYRRKKEEWGAPKEERTEAIAKGRSWHLFGKEKGKKVDGVIFFVL
jgi:hypothetical protein